MTPEEIIASGLLEAYVMGQTTPAEAQVVERMRKEFPAVQQELLALEEALERTALAQAVPPPARARAAVMRAIGAPGADRVVPMPAAAAPKRTNWLMAACVVALLGSFAMNAVLYSRLGRMQDQLARLESDRTVIAQELQVQRTALQGSKDQLAVMLDPHRRVVNLAGLPIDPTGGARVYWDPASHEVHLDVLSLPTPPAGKQYQLWALADGVPVDAGVFDVGNVEAGLQRMKPIAAAQAFAVTLENAGGVPSPTLSAMYLMGQAG